MPRCVTLAPTPHTYTNLTRLPARSYKGPGHAWRVEERYFLNMRLFVVGIGTSFRLDVGRPLGLISCYFLASDPSVSGLEAAAPLLETEADTKLATSDHGGSSAAEVALNAKAAPQTKGAKSAGDSKPASDSAMTAATKTESHAVRIPHHTCTYCLCWPTSLPFGPLQWWNLSTDLTHPLAGPGDAQAEEQGGAAQAPSAHHAHPGAEGPLLPAFTPC